MAGSEFNFFQLPNGVDGGADMIDNQYRSFDKTLSNYGDLDKGTKYAYGFKDEKMNPMPKDVDGSMIENPYQEGSTIKRVRNDKMVRMSMGDITYVNMETNDPKRTDADADYYLPEEGWRSFGGRRDFDRAYQGSRLQG